MAGSASVHWDGSVIRVHYRGYIDGAAMREGTNGVKRCLLQRQPSAILFDTIEVEGYSPEVRAPGVEMFRALKDNGVGRAVAISTSSAVRMMGSVFAFATGMPLEFVDSRAEGERRVALR
ncbi:STAS/SEC14 domain-containing protein [Sandaracinus amylolyticus]|uniref:STAS/SEC14 domain-containing protein n=1 Tax=Sandaracinus amylolyticus TaxID=927083 RepID=UPI001F3F3673|nr:STAS/SEC14 domain-containing protein [Sandaracinus amylolyticus]UJR86298.1 Hypothetical protein I5071_83820 [Sandaracinus amylolyticus]